MTMQLPGLLLFDWPEGNPTALGACRREMIVGERFAFRWKQGGPPLAVEMVRRPSTSTAEIVDGSITPDVPGLYRFVIYGVHVEAIAFGRRALDRLVPTNPPDAQNIVTRNSSRYGFGALGLRSMANDPSVDEARCIATLEAGSDYPVEP